MEERYAYIIKYKDARNAEKEIIVKLPTNVKKVILDDGSMNEKEFVTKWLKDVSVKMLKEAGLTISSLTVGHSDIHPAK